jgi:hypothetical protein
MGVNGGYLIYLGDDVMNKTEWIKKYCIIDCPGNGNQGRITPGACKRINKAAKKATDKVTARKPLSPFDKAAYRMAHSCGRCRNSSWHWSPVHVFDDPNLKSEINLPDDTFSIPGLGGRY